MTMRTISKTIVFTRPFTLAGFNGTQPAGSYVVETDIQKGTAEPMWRRRSTLSRLPTQPGVNPGADQGATVCSAELAAALLQDGAASALRFESCARQTHRSSMKVLFETMTAERVTCSDAIDTDTTL